MQNHDTIYAAITTEVKGGSELVGTMPCTALLWAILASSVVDSMCFVTGPSMMGTQRRSPQAAPISVEGENPFVSRRGLAWLALSIVALPVAANADGDEPVLKLPEAERIKAPEYACAQVIQPTSSTPVKGSVQPQGYPVLAKMAVHP